jgi:Subtilase family/WD40-like Beta Propeller Repeat
LRIVVGMAGKANRTNRIVVPVAVGAVMVAALAAPTSATVLSARVWRQTAEQVTELCSQTPLPAADWILKTYAGPAPSDVAKQLGMSEPVRLVVVDEGPPNLLPTFGPVTVFPESNKVVADTSHIRTMLGLAAAENQGVARIPGIEIQAVTVHSIDDEGAYERAIGGILTRAGVSKTGTVTGPPQRVVVAMPISFGGLFATPDIRKLLKAGAKSGRVLWFSSGGNSGDGEVPKPASYEEVIGVVSATAAGTPVRGVPTGNGLDLGAAGDCQITPNDTGGQSLSTGSSGASVIAASLGARVWVGNPTMHAAQVRQVLESATAQKVKTDRLGWGVTNLNLVPPDNTPPTIRFKKISAGRVQISVTDAPSSQPPGLPQSGVIVSYTSSLGDKRPVMLPPTKPVSATFLNATDPCRQYCATVNLKPGEHITVTTIDSSVFTSLQGKWAGDLSTLSKEVRFTTAVWPTTPTKSVSSNPTKTIELQSTPSTSTLPSSTLPATTVPVGTTTPSKPVGKILFTDLGDIGFREVGKPVSVVIVKDKNGGNVPVWSPDGKLIAFEADRSNHSEIYVMNADGSNQRQLTTTLPPSLNYPFFGAFNATWSPDGQSIMYSSLFQGIWLINLDGSNLRKIVGDKTMHVSYPEWSPDGTTIAYSRSVPGRQNDIWIMSPDGSNQQQVTNDPSDERLPRWSPDSKQISFMASTKGNSTFDVRGRINRDGTERSTNKPTFYGQQCSLWPTGGCGERPGT